MQRELRFRARKKKTGEWIYWWMKDPINLYSEEIDFSTIGQFTGIRDNKGKEVYEGDILYAYEDNWAIRWDNYEGNYANYILYKPMTNTFPETINRADWIGENVVGNIYENPELIKK